MLPSPHHHRDRLRRLAVALAPAALGRRFYVGRRERSQPAVFVVGADVRRLTHPGALGWGSAGAGSRHLADGLLRDATGRRPSLERTWRFADEVVATLPVDGFVLAAEDVRQWGRHI